MILGKIQEVFGQLKIEWNEFTNCGIKHHMKLAESKWDLAQCTMDQVEYIKGIKTMDAHHMSRQNPNSEVTDLVQGEFWSILGALAFSLLTRTDIAVFVCALQRHTSRPKYIHCKRSLKLHK